MWKALIKLVEKWAYRCEHKWGKEHTNNVYSSDDPNGLPIRITRTYLCSKCMEIKKVD